MSIDIRLSTAPFIADILFKNGLRRRIDYHMAENTGRFMIFLVEEPADGRPADSIFVNVDSIETVDLAKSALTAGRA